jgi:hypothetical protein
LLSGLTEALGSDARLQLPRKQQTISGLIRFEAEDFANFEETVGRDPPNIAIVLVGISDRAPLRAQNWRRVVVGSDEWKAEYGRRVDRLMKILKKRNAAVYWVGLPIVRRPDWSSDLQMLNDIVRERALQNNVKYIDVYDAFADESGGYSQSGPDLTGKSRVLRDNDGVGFTGAGNRKLAYFVERELKRDLTQARNDRNVPLAGSETEQRRLMPKQEVPPQTGWDSTVKAGGEASPTAKDGARPSPSERTTPGAPPSLGDQKADNTKVTIKTIGRTGREEVSTLEILRPAIPASVIALVTRRESPDRPSQLGETVTDTLPGGIIVMSSIAPGLGAGSLAQRRRLAPTQTPFFKVLVKGERLTPRPGRADDFSWPRTDADGGDDVKPLPAPQPVLPSRRELPAKS